MPIVASIGHPRLRAFDNNGKPLAGGKLYTYRAGSTTPAVTYTDHTGNVPNPVAITLNLRGEAVVWLDIGVSYKFIVTDDDGSILTTDDHISAPSSSAEFVDNLSTGNGTGVGFRSSLAGSVLLSVNDKLNERISVKDFGARGDGTTDDTAAIQAAVNAAIDSGARSLHITHGVYRISTQILITSPLNITGDGCAASIIRQTNGVGGGFNFDYGFYKTGGGLTGVMIEAGAGYETSNHAFTGSGSTGIGLRVAFANDNFSVQDVSIHNFDTCVQVIGCFNTRWQRCRGLFFKNFGIVIDSGVSNATTYIGGDNRFRDFKVSNNGYTGDNTVSQGISVKCSGGEHFYSCDATKTRFGFVVAPPANSQVTYLWFDSCLADTCDGDGWTFDGTTSPVISVQCVNCWGAYSAQGAGLLTRGSLLNSVRWVGGRLRENGGAGWDHQGGLNCSVDSAEIAANSTATTGAAAGVSVAAGVSSWALTNSRVGNFASGFTGQGDGIKIAAGSSGQFRIIGNDFSNPGEGKVSVNNGASTLTYIISGNLPIQGSGINETRGQLLSGNTLGTVAAATTTFLGPNGNQANELDNLFIAGRPCVLRQIQVQTDLAPGASQSFTYTVRLNNVDTGAIGVITGTSTFLTVISAPITLGSTDHFSIKLVTSAGATATRHRWSIATDA
jgi:hypothetical protein